MLEKEKPASRGAGRVVDKKELGCLRRFLIFQIRYRYLRKRMFVEKVGVTESTGIKMIVGVVAKIWCNEALKLTFKLAVINVCFPAKADIRLLTLIYYLLP